MQDDCGRSLFHKGFPLNKKPRHQAAVFKINTNSIYLINSLHRRTQLVNRVVNRVANFIASLAFEVVLDTHLIDWPNPFDFDEDRLPVAH